MTPENADTYQLAERIISRTASVPSTGEVLGVIQAFYGKNKPTHDPMKTILMQVVYALSTDTQVALMLQSPPGVVKVKRLFEFLRESSDRQFIQAWSGDPAQDVADRKNAWETFATGVNILKDSPQKLKIYLGHAVEHDKDYGQTLESTQSYQFHLGDEAAGGDEIDFGADLRSSFREGGNGNIWVGGMAGSGPVREQLTRSVITTNMKKYRLKRREK